MFSSWQWIIILVILVIVYILSSSNEKPKDYDCYDKSPYKCGKCRKNCKWRYIAEKFEELERESEVEE